MDVKKKGLGETYVYIACVLVDNIHKCMNRKTQRTISSASPTFSRVSRVIVFARRVVFFHPRKTRYAIRVRELKF